MNDINFADGSGYECVQVAPITGHLLCCLCDLSADDFAGYVAGLPVSICAEHKAAKLESLARLNVAIAFAKEGGGVETLGEVMEASA